MSLQENAKQWASINEPRKALRQPHPRATAQTCHPEPQQILRRYHAPRRTDRASDGDPVILAIDRPLVLRHQPLKLCPQRYLAEAIDTSHLGFRPPENCYHPHQFQVSFGECSICPKNDAWRDRFRMAGFSSTHCLTLCCIPLVDAGRNSP